MNQTYVIVWSETALELYRIPSEGLWGDSVEVIREMPSHRPTRTIRLDNDDVINTLSDDVSRLINGIDIALPLWFLIPEGWIMRFVVPKIQMDNAEDLRFYLHWEAQERLYDNYKDYAILVQDSGGDNYELYAVRKLVLDLVEVGSRNANVDLAGIGYHPAHGESYSFEYPLDFREAIPIETAHQPELSTKKVVSPYVSAAIIAGLIAAIGGFTVLTMSDKSVKPTSGKTSKSVVVAEKSSSSTKPAEVKMQDSLSLTKIPSNASIADNDTVKKDTKTVSTLITEPTKVADKPIAETVTASVPVSQPSKTDVVKSVVKEEVANVYPVSPLSQFVKLLPSEASLRNIVVSPVEFRAEIAGLSNPESWLSRVKGQAEFKNASIVGANQLSQDRVFVKISNSGTKSSMKSKNSDNWQLRARNSGLTVSPRKATGSKTNVLKFADSLWEDMDGFSKMYISQDNDTWIIVVQ